MQLRMFQVDVFAGRTFGGNPAAVVLLEDDWLPDDVLQAVAAENNLAETAFVAPAGTGVTGTELGWGLRWFTPTTEVELCGHATLAAGYVVLRHLVPGATTVSFATRWAGRLEVFWKDPLHLAVALPLHEPGPAASTEVADAVAHALGARPAEVVRAPATIARFDSADEVAALSPDFRAVAALETPWVVATAKGPGGFMEADWVCRYFAPGSGIDEDHATGSAQTYLAPYWWPQLDSIHWHGADVEQLSPRGGFMKVQITSTSSGPVVLLTGAVADYLDGTITFPLPDDPPGPVVGWDEQSGAGTGPPDNG